MDEFDLDVEEKNIVGGLDRLLINIGMAFVAIIPTYFYLIFRPKAMCYMLRGEEADGRQGLKLGPGVTFIFAILILLGVKYIFRDAVNSSVAPANVETVGSAISSAISDGNIWQSIVLSLPLFFAALICGVSFHISHRVLGKISNLTQALGIGFYTLSTFLLIILPIGVVSDKFGSESTQTSIAAAFFVISFLLVMPWQIFSFSRHAFGNSRGGAAAVTLVSSILIFSIFWGLGALMTVLN